MICCIAPRALTGEIEAVPSKSALHRLLIAAALSEGGTLLRRAAASADIEATCACLRALGAGIERAGDGFRVSPIERVLEAPLLDCGESGSTLRFLLPVAAALSGARFVGHGSLPARPIGALREALIGHGARFSGETLPFTVSGRLSGGEFFLPGNVSSQYATGLLLALPLLGGGEIALTTPMRSRGYVDMTLGVLGRFGVRAEHTARGYGVPAGQAYRTPGEAWVEGDWSNAAFFLAAGAIGGPVTLRGLDESSAQGDKAVCEILCRMGAAISRRDGAITVSPGDLRGVDIDAGDIPDLVPALAVAAAAARGKTRVHNAARLRYKESDRLHTVAALLQALGGTAEETPDGLLIYGNGRLVGGECQSAGDHRVAMAAAIASLCCDSPVTLCGAEAVNKSYPSFFADLCKLGGVLECRP